MSSLVFIGIVMDGVTSIAINDGIVVLESD
jgi:hypothetical protein